MYNETPTHPIFAVPTEEEKGKKALKRFAACVGLSLVFIAGVAAIDRKLSENETPED